MRLSEVICFVTASPPQHIPSQFNTHTRILEALFLSMLISYNSEDFYIIVFAQLMCYFQKPWDNF